jgi:hypothetical protein
MKTRAGSLIWICIVLAVVSLGWIGYNSFMYLQQTQLFARPAIYVNLMWIGLLLFFFSHLIIILSTILSLKNSHAMSITGNILIVFGVISLIILLFQYIALDQLEEDFQYGDPYNSTLKLAWITELILAIFFLYSLIYFLKLRNTIGQNISTKSVSREQIYVAMNITGIVCSVLGIFIVFFYTKMYNGVRIPLIFKLIPYGIVLSPYLLALGGWGIRRFNDRRSGWNDEKQNSDINRSGMVALLVSLTLTLGLAIFYFHKLPVVFKQIDVAGVILVFLLPFYLFVVLFVFSVGALYNFKNN